VIAEVLNQLDALDQCQRSVIATAKSSEWSKDQRQGRDRYDAKTHQRNTDRIDRTQLKHGGLPTRLTR
jgi:hypothetical protein